MELINVALESITESSGNPRTVYDPEALAELADDIKQRGLLQPVTVRPATAAGLPLPGQWELVIGHRRLRAAKAAGLEELPAVVRELSDVQVLEAQLVENLQREDLHPLEVAQGYRDLHEKHGIPVEDIAEKVGKSKASVYAAMRLMDLTPKAQEAFRAGKLNASTALLVARIPDAKLQLEATKAITDPRYGTGALSVREAQDLVHRDFMLELKSAPFDATDPELVPAAGACTACPKRTGAQPELFSDVKNADVCTDVPCYRTKEDACWAQKVAEGKVGGPKTLSESEGKAVFGEHGGVRSDASYVPADQQCQDDQKWRPYRELLGKAAKAHVVLARSPKGEIVELLPKVGLNKLLAEVGKIKKLERHAAPHLTKEGKAQREAEEKKAKIRRQVVSAAIGQLVTSWEKAIPGKKTWLAMAKALAPTADVTLARRVKDGGSAKELKAYEKNLETISEGALRGFVLEAALEHVLHETQGGYSDVLKELSAVHGIELKGLEQEAKSADKPPAKGDVVIPKKGKAMKKGTCRECGCDENNACSGGCAWTDKTETLCTNCIPEGEE